MEMVTITTDTEPLSFTLVVIKDSQLIFDTSYFRVGEASRDYSETGARIFNTQIIHIQCVTTQRLFIQHNNYCVSLIWLWKFYF